MSHRGAPALRTPTRRRRAPAAVLVAAWAGACAPPTPMTTGDALQPAGLGAPALAGLFVGCWALAWDGGRAGGAEGATLPDSVSLRDGIVFGTGERLVSPATHPAGRQASGLAGGASWEARYRINRWWVEGDSLRLRFSDGAGDDWLLWLGEEGEALVGRGSRGRRSGPEARVRAAPIACDFG